jgi:uncharacterized protein (DUF302 family)
MIAENPHIANYEDPGVAQIKMPNREGFIPIRNLIRPGCSGKNEMAHVVRRAILTAVALLTIMISLTGERAMAADGLITIRSAFGPEATMNRLEAEVRAKGLTVFAHVDHAAGAKAVGMPLRPTDLLIFGNAKGGTPLMQAEQTIGIDLPLKALVWQDAAGVTWLSYNDPYFLAQRHGLDDATKAAVEALSGALKAISGKATMAP